jgi:hypothetical protein
MKEHKHDFKKLVHVAFKYYKENNCCTVIAVAVAANIGFGKAYHAMKREGRQDRRGAYFAQYESALNKLGYRVEPSEVYMGKTLVSAKRICPKRGTFLIRSAGHVTCIRDGVMVDWAEDRNSRKRVKVVYEVIKN